LQEISMSGTSRILWSLLLCCGLALAQGCGDDGGDGDGGGSDAGNDTGSDAGNDAGGDTGGGDTGGGTCGERTECSGNADCASNEFCQSGCCQDRPTAQVCTVAGGTCNDASWSTDNFICSQDAVGEPGECLERCSSDSLTSSDPGGCTSGSFCLEIDGDPIVSADGTILDGVCLVGDCNDVGADGDYTCDDGAGTCYAFGNNASFCITAGTQSAGADCIPGAGEATETCAAGLLCYQGACVEPCSANADCEGSTECVAVFDQSGNNRPGVCTTSCDAFSEGQCPEGQVCDVNIGPYTGQLTGWACRDIEDGVDVVGYQEECDPEGEDSQCGEGLVCVPNAADDTVGRCEQFCDPTGDVTDDFGTCAVGAGATLGDGTTEEGSASVWTLIAAGTYPSMIFVDGEGDEVFEGDGATLAEGGSYTVVAYNDEDADPASAAFLDDTDSEVDAGETLVQLYNTTGEALDLYSARIFGEAIAPGTVEAVDDLNPAADYENLLPEGAGFTYLAREASEGGETYNVIVHGITDDEETPVSSLWLGYEAPTFETDSGAVRVLHAFPGAEPIWVGEEVAYGGVSDWIAAAEGDYELDVLAEEGGTTLFTIEIEMTADAAYTVVVYPDGVDPTYHTLAEDLEVESDEVIAVRVVNVSDEDLTYAIGEPWLTDVEGTDSVVAESSEVLLFFGSPEAEAGDAPIAFVNEAAAEDESMLSILAAYDDSEEPAIAGWAISTDLPAAEDSAGNAVARFWNAAFGSGALQVTTPGAALEVCLELAIDGLGRCAPICTPYMEGEWEDEDGELTGRWEDNGCPHDEDVVYGCIAVETPDYEFGCDVAPLGACLPRPAEDATGVVGDSCNGDADCGPDLFCADDGNGGGECTKLCLPNSLLPSDCGEGTVCAISISRIYSLCVEPVVDAGAGEPCSAAESGEYCAEDNTLCAQVTATDYECISTCTRSCVGTCPGDSETRSTCTAAINPALDPPDEIALCQ
jgi:hypothetical protein